jgi:hypothetical protein
VMSLLRQFHERPYPYLFISPNNDLNRIAWASPNLEAALLS